MKYTTNYNLKKPDQDDFYNIEDLNSNAEVIDTELKKIDEKANATEQNAKAYTNQKIETLTQETTQAIDVVNQKITSHKADLANKTDETKGASLVGIKPITGLTGDNVRSAIQNLFQYANDGKTVVANAVTAKGVIASPSDTFPTLANKIGQIQTDQTGDATAVAGDIIVGKTAYAKGTKLTGTLALTGNAPVANVLASNTFYTTDPKTKLTGTMVNRGAVTNTITTQNGSYTIPAGYHSGAGKVTATFSNLTAANIKKGITVGGITGTHGGGWMSAGINLDIEYINITSSRTINIDVPISNAIYNSEVHGIVLISSIDAEYTSGDRVASNNCSLVNMSPIGVNIYQEVGFYTSRTRETRLFLSSFTKIATNTIRALVDVTIPPDAKSADIYVDNAFILYS